MDKFSGLYVKSNGEWSVHGKLTEDVEKLRDNLRKITSAGGEITTGKTKKKIQAAAIIHSTKGLLKSRSF